MTLDRERDWIGASGTSISIIQVHNEVSAVRGSRPGPGSGSGCGRVRARRCSVIPGRLIGRARAGRVRPGGTCRALLSMANSRFSLGWAASGRIAGFERVKRTICMIWTAALGRNLLRLLSPWMSCVIEFIFHGILRPGARIHGYISFLAGCDFWQAIVARRLELSRSFPPCYIVINRLTATLALMLYTIFFLVF